MSSRPPATIMGIELMRSLWVKEKLLRNILNSFGAER
jgi:hypothetical protein